MARVGPERAAEVVSVRPFAPLPDQMSDANTLPPVQIKSLGRFLQEYVPLDYAIEPIIRTGSLYTLTAKTGAGKTAWMIATALAVATGRSDIIGREVERGRVAFLTFENPDDVRMRIMVAAFLLNIDVREISEALVIIDVRAKPEAIEEALRIETEKGGSLRLVFVDTFAAFFDGDDVNNPVQGGEFMRRMRPWTRLPGLPAVVVAAHPVKNAGADQLVPYGSGAILNEVDGNLTLWRKEGGTVSFHWLGKLRGLEFSEVIYRFEIAGSPDVLDVKGRQVTLPTMVPAAEVDVEVRAQAEIDIKVALLRAIDAHPTASQRQLAAAIGSNKSAVNRHLSDLRSEKLVQETLGRIELTAKAKAALAKAA